MASRVRIFMNDLGFREESLPPLICDKIAYFLKSFDTLVVCARTSGEDASLTPLLSRIDQVFTRNAEFIELHGAIPVDLVPDFGADLKSFEVEMDEWYTIFSNSPRSRSPMLIDVIEIIDSVVEDLQNFHRLEFSDTGDETEGMEEKLQLFRNFIEFVEMLNVDGHQQVALEGFVIQVASVAVDAAHVCARLHGLFDAWNVQGWNQVKHGWKQIHPGVSALLQRIRPVGVEVSMAYNTAMCISKSTEELRYSMDLDPAHYSVVVVIKHFIDFLLWCLWETLEMDCCLGDSMKDQVRPIWGGLKFLRAHAHEFDEKEMRSVVCEAGSIIFSPRHQDYGIAGLVENLEMIVLEMKENISGGFITEGIKTLQVDMSQIMPGSVTEILPPVYFLTTDEVVGLEDDVRSILDRLTSGTRRLTINPIVGMAGLGKTTLALQIYKRPSVMHYFKCHAWYSFSSVYSRNKFLVDLLNQIQPNLSSRYLGMTEGDLVDQLRQSLKGKRYLVCLDNVRDHRIWKTLDMCFPDDRIGSRILITSRDGDVIRRSLLHQVPFLLRPRSDFESLEILRTKLFPHNFPVELHGLAVRIAESCKGLPMIIVAVSRILTTTNPDVWMKVLESLNSNTLSTTEQLSNLFELCYGYLPNHLKLCLKVPPFYQTTKSYRVQVLI